MIYKPFETLSLSRLGLGNMRLPTQGDKPDAPIDYDRAMRRVPRGMVTTVGEIRAFFAREAGADFTEPITAGVFVSIAAWASFQRQVDETPYWRTLKAGGELNPKYPGGIEAQREKLEAEGHTVIRRGRKNFRYYVEDYEKVLYRF